jgi:hypothetical protein
MVHLHQLQLASLCYLFIEMELFVLGLDLVMSR